MHRALTKTLCLILIRMSRIMPHPQGIVYTTENGADTILMAFSNPGYSPALQAAIDYAWDNGVVLVATTGNDGVNTLTYPAADRGVIGVSSTDSNDVLASDSNYGQDVFLAAPGVDIVTTNAGGTYTSISGTSAAAAHVAGAAAFMHAFNPTFTNGVIVGKLARNADAVGTREQTGNRRLNLARTVSDSSTASVKPVGAAPTGSGGPFVGPYVAAAISFGSVTVSPQVGSLTYGTGGSVTFPVNVNINGSGGGSLSIALRVGKNITY